MADKMNLTLLTDFYELTMANGYFLDPGKRDLRVAFDVFYRRNPDQAGFAIFAGLEQIVDYITGMRFSREDVEYIRSLGLYDEAFLQYLEDFRFHGDVYAFPEGTVMYPNEPITRRFPSLSRVIVCTGSTTASPSLAAPIFEMPKSVSTACPLLPVNIPASPM